jgi:cytochrome c peroxidase
LDLEDAEVRLIAAWLDSLTGDLPRDYIRRPELPPSTGSTPRADPS